MRKALIGAAVMLWVFAPTAHADDNGFLDAVGQLGYTNRSEALRNGYTVCVMRTEADADLTDRVIRGALDWLNRDEAAADTDEFAAAAVKYLCPEVVNEPAG